MGCFSHVRREQKRFFMLPKCPAIQLAPELPWKAFVVLAASIGKTRDKQDSLSKGAECDSNLCPRQPERCDLGYRNPKDPRYRAGSLCLECELDFLLHRTAMFQCFSLSKVVDGCGACHVLSSFPNSDSDSAVSLDRTRLGATDLMRSGKFQSLQPRTGVPSSTSQGTETAELGYRANSSNS